MNTIKHVIMGYASYILIGWLLLCLPIAQQTYDVCALDNLFTASSAVSTTGLVTVSVSDHYSFLGQIIILLMIQLGGVGYMTFGSFIILMRKQTFTNQRNEIAKTVFSLPHDFKITKFIVSVITFTFIIETIGAVALYRIFLSLNVENPLWSAIFHSVSSFCTAGFGLYNNSFESYSANGWLIIVIAALSYLGAIGFIVCMDLWRKIRKEVAHITLTSKIILHATFWISIVGTVLLFISEPSIQSLPAEEQWLASFFQVMTAMTTVGFNTIPIGELSRATLLLIIILMVIGASPSGTGGGLKTTTFTAMFGIMKSTVHGSNDVTFWKRSIPQERLMTASASVGFYVSSLLLGLYLLSLTESQPFESLFFETASALGTVGLSTGITSSLTELGKIIVILLMFIGRLGTITFGIALFHKEHILLNEKDDLAV
jgi:trk system potassium uptake protein TrkH